MSYLRLSANDSAIAHRDRLAVFLGHARVRCGNSAWYAKKTQIQSGLVALVSCER
jgi:hypothetical protein